MSKEETNLDPEVVRALEAILLVAMEPVAPALLAQLLEISQATVEALCERLATTYESAGHGFQLVPFTRPKAPVPAKVLVAPVPGCTILSAWLKASATYSSPVGPVTMA